MRRRNTCAGTFRNPERECSGDWESAPRPERPAPAVLPVRARIGERARGSAPGRRVRRSGGPGAGTPSRRNAGLPPARRVAGAAMAALAGPGYDKPVWHCAVRAAPEDRMLSDAEWAQVAARVMHRTGLAPDGDELGVRWVAVRHAADHIHIVATLARQDGTWPKTWNDYYRVGEACHDAERRFGLRSTAPADRTAGRRPTRAETEQAARRGWAESARVTLRGEVCT